MLKSDFTPDVFVEEVNEIDAHFQKEARSKSGMEYVLWTLDNWVPALEKLIQTHRKVVRANIKDYETAATSAFNSISPFFTEFLDSLDYDSFPYKISKKDFNSFISRLKKLRSPSDADTIIDEFRTNIPHKDRYYFNKYFRPWHPIHYILVALRKSYFHIYVDDMIRNLYPYILMPQNKTFSDLVCVLSCFSGITPNRIARATSCEIIDKHNIKMIIDRHEEQRTIYCESDYFLNTFKTMMSIISRKGNLMNYRPHIIYKTLDHIIDPDFTFTYLPKLHLLICEYLFPNVVIYVDDKSSMANFTISGTLDLSRIISEFKAERDLIIDNIINDTPDYLHNEIRTIMKYCESNFNGRIGVERISEMFGVGSTRSRRLNAILAKIGLAGSLIEH